MRKTLFILLMAVGLSSCGGSGSSASWLTTEGREGSFLSSTVELDQQFVYALSADRGELLAYKVAEEEAGGHDHGHVHAQHDHDDEHDHEHEHDHEQGTDLDLVELDGSPYRLADGSAQSLVLVSGGKALIVLFSDGMLRSYPIDGVTGLLAEPSAVDSQVNSPRALRVSPEGDAVAVLGDSLAIFPLPEDGGLPSQPALLPDTANWSDLALGHHGGAGATVTGAIGFSWQRGGPITLGSETALPGTARAGLALSHDELFVVNSQDRSVSKLHFDEDNATLMLVETFSLPEELTDPSVVTVLSDGEELLVGGADALILLHRHDDDWEEEGHLELDQEITALYAVPSSNSVLVAHALGHGFHLVQVEHSLTALAELAPEHSGITSFGVADRAEVVTVTEQI